MAGSEKQPINNDSSDPFNIGVRNAQEQVIDLYLKKFPEGSWQQAEAFDQVASFFQKQGNLRAADGYYRQAVDRMRRSYPEQTDKDAAEQEFGSELYNYAYMLAGTRKPVTTDAKSLLADRQMAAKLYDECCPISKKHGSLLDQAEFLEDKGYNEISIAIGFTQGRPVNRKQLLRAAETFHEGLELLKSENSNSDVKKKATLEGRIAFAETALASFTPAQPTHRRNAVEAYRSARNYWHAFKPEDEAESKEKNNCLNILLTNYARFLRTEGGRHKNEAQDIAKEQRNLKVQPDPEN